MNNTDYNRECYGTCYTKTPGYIRKFFQWFSDNKIKANSDKCYFICSSNQKANLSVKNEEIAKKIYV